MQTTPNHRLRIDSADATLTKATLRAAELLGLPNSILADVVGVSESTISRMGSGKAFELDTKPAELATLLVRLYRSLDALVGNNDHQRRKWMSSYNNALNAVPREAIQNSEGLVRVVTYLDGADTLT